MFDKNTLKNLTAIKGIEAANITSEQISAINTELTEKGLAVEVSACGTIADLEAKVANVDALTASNETLTSDLSAANEKVTDLEAKLAEANAKLDKTPGATAEEIQAEKDKIAKEDQDVDVDTEISNALKEKYGL